MSKAERAAIAAAPDIVQILDQGKYWRTADGMVVRISKIEQAHRLSILSYLERNLDRIAYVELALMRCPDIEGWLEGEIREWEARPAEALRRTKLYQAMLTEINRNAGRA